MDIKNVTWGINTIGANGVPGSNDIEFGATKSGEPAFKLGNTIVTPDTVGNNRVYKKLRKDNTYLYEIVYEDLDYSFAERYLRENFQNLPFACSSVRNGNFYGRNLDWYYNHSVDFVCYVPAKEGRYASVGIAGGLGALTENFVESGEYTDLYKILPFFTQDGINEKHVFANINVVPIMCRKTVGTKPTGEKKTTINMLQMIRYILDNYDSATNAVNDIMEHVSISGVTNLWNMGYECHCMVGDTTNTYLIEFIDNEMKVIDMTNGSNSPLAGKPYMTNFPLYNTVLNEDGTVYTPSTQDEEHNAITTNHIDEYGSGLERYNLIAENYSSANDKEGMSNLMDMLKYTNAYSLNNEPQWYTEFVGVRNLTVISTPEEYDPVKEIAYDLFVNRSRDQGTETWHTTHSCVYDIENCKVYVHSQEGEDEYVFGLEPTALDLPVVTSSDNGKILKVVDGQWAVVDAD